MGPDLPIGSEIAAALLLGLAAALTIVWKRIASKSERQDHDELAPIMRRLDESDRAIRERIAQHERQVMQGITSLGEHLSRQHREKELEDRRQYDRIMDRMDRFGHHD